jgi:hypothetical protein
MAEAAKIKAGSGFHEEVSRPEGNEKSELGSDLKTTPKQKLVAQYEIQRRFSLQTQIKSIHLNHRGHRPHTLF